MTPKHIFLIILLALFVSLPPTSAADYNFYKCSDNSSLGTSYNITFTAAGSDTSVCVNSSGVSSTNLAINVSGYPDGKWRSIDSFDVSSEISNPVGIEWVSSFVYVLDNDLIGGDVWIYKYYPNGTYTGIRFNLSSEINGTYDGPWGLDWNGSVFAVSVRNTEVSAENRVVFYDLSGSYTGFSFSTDGEMDETYGISWNGSDWLVLGENGSDFSVYVYNIAGIFTGRNYSITARTVGITAIECVGSYCYISYGGRDVIAKIDSDGNELRADYIGDITERPTGLSWNGTNLWMGGEHLTEEIYVLENETSLPALSLDLSNNSIIDWSLTGDLNSTNSPQWTSGIAPGAFTSGNMLILNWTSDGPGNLTLSGINWGPWITASAPANDYTTTNTSAILTCTATDPDNATLNYYFYWNGTLIDSNANGSFNFTHADLEQMQNWSINVSDELNANITTSTRNLTIDYTHINLYDENLGTHRTDNGSIFFLNYNYQTVNHTIGNNITLKNLDANLGKKVIVREWNASSANYPYLRELVSISYAAGEDFDIYSPSTSDLVVHPKLTLNDVTGDFPANITILRIKRYINDILVIIHEGTFGVDKSVAAYLISDIPYQISVDNGDEVRENGEYTPYGSDTTPVYIGPVTYAPGTSIYDVISWDITEGSIKVNYYDASGGTTAISIVMYNDTNRSQVLVNCTSTVSTYSCTYAPPGNMSVYIDITASTGYGSYHASKVHRYWDAAINFDVGLLDSWHYTVMSLILIFGVFLLFNEMHSGIGAIAGVAITGMCRFFGWITISAPIMAVLVLFAVFVVMVRRKP